MKKRTPTTVQHLRNSAFLATGATIATMAAYRVAEAKAEGVTQAETVDVDFGTAVPHEVPAATAPSGSGDLQGQFVFLLVLTALGMVGIVGMLRDFRHGRAHAH